MHLYFIIYLFSILGYSIGPVGSYCDYESGFTTDANSSNLYKYSTGNYQEICDSRMLRSLKVLNANYAPSSIQFVLHPNYPNMLHDTDPGFDGFYERATGGNAMGPSADAIRAHYNIDNAINIYIVDFVNTRDGTYGISTYPWSLGIPGTFFKHGFLPGDVDAREKADYDRTLMHEIGHYFGLLHINGIWYVGEDNTPRELVGGDDCNEHGDTICDTPAEPGMSNGAWYTNYNNRECIYHGYGGHYNTFDSTLQIGGYKQTYFHGYYPFYDYCKKWEVEDFYRAEYFVMAFDTANSYILPGCGNLIDFDLNGEATGLSEITVLNAQTKSLAFDYYDEHDIIDGCDLPDMNLYITENGNVLFNSSDYISHFQFNVDGTKIISISGGKAQENHFDIKFDHCQQFTNYDEYGDFFGTNGLNSDECNNDDKSVYATKCHIDNYSDLPIGHNFMRAGSFPYNRCGLSPINDNDYYDKNRNGFTNEQYLNIRYFVEHCFTGCTDTLACNFDTTSTHLLRKGISSCEYSWETDKDCENDCIHPSEQLTRSKNLKFSTQSYINSLSDYDLDCATDELFDKFTVEGWTNLVKIRKKIKELVNEKLQRKQLDTLYIPVVFHNLYKIETLSSNTTMHPKKCEITQIYPNPFNPITNISYGLSHNTDINISIYDITGRLISSLINEFQTAGYHTIIWDASDSASGIYFIQLASENFTESRKIVLIK